MSVTVELRERGETDRARSFRVERPGGGYSVVHLPKKLISSYERIGSWETHPDLCRVTVPDWLARREGLV